MFPQHTMIFFMHANTVFDRLNSSMEVREMGIKILNQAQTVASLHIFKQEWFSKSISS
jgi:hypothetical protein